MEHFDDEFLAGRAAAGDDEALAVLLGSAEPVLLRYARKCLSRTVRLTAAPEDVVQETFVEAARLIASFEPRGPRSFNSWLLRIAHFRVKAAVKRHNVRTKHGLVGRFDDGESVLYALEELAVFSRTPSKSAADRELIELVSTAIGSLPQHFRDVVTFRHLQGLGIDETAAKMGRDRATIPALTTRALNALRDKLQTASRMG